MEFWPVWHIRPCDFMDFKISVRRPSLIVSSKASDCFPALPSGGFRWKSVASLGSKACNMFCNDSFVINYEPPSLPALFCLRWGLVGWWTPDLLALRQFSRCLVPFCVCPRLALSAGETATFTPSVCVVLCPARIPLFLHVCLCFPPFTAVPPRPIEPPCPRPSRKAPYDVNVWWRAQAYDCPCFPTHTGSTLKRMTGGFAGS